MHRNMHTKYNFKNISLVMKKFFGGICFPVLDNSKCEQHNYTRSFFVLGNDIYNSR